MICPSKPASLPILPQATNSHRGAAIAYWQFDFGTLFSADLALVDFDVQLAQRAGAGDDVELDVVGSFIDRAERTVHGAEVCTACNHTPAFRRGFKFPVTFYALLSSVGTVLSQRPTRARRAWYADN